MKRTFFLFGWFAVCAAFGDEYHLASPDRSLDFCVSTDGAESRLSPVTQEDAAFAARYADFALADNADDMIRAMNGAAVGRELWRYAAVPLLCLILLEILLTRWITQQRRTGEEGRVAFDEANRPSSKFTEILNAIKNGGK